MQKYLFYCAVFTILFVGTNVLNLMGWKGDTLIKSINVATYFLIAAVAWVHLKGRKVKYIQHSFWLFATYVVYVVISYILGKKAFFGFPTNTLLLLYLFTLMYNDRSRIQKETCLKMILLSYVVTCVMAIVERVFLYHFFPLVLTDDELIFQFQSQEGFRSTALHNHPLSNALFITIIMLFIFVSKMKNTYKLLFWGLGYLAILCFNTRSSMILWPLLLAIYFIYENFRNKKMDVIHVYGLTAVVVAGLFFAVSTFGLGDRLFEAKALMDDSANVRVAVWEMFTKQDLLKLFFSFGYSSQETAMIMSHSNIHIIENSFVIFFFNYGGILFIAVLVSYYFAFRQYMSRYTIFQSLFCILGFLVLGNTNNGIGDYSLSTLLLCAMFMPVTSRLSYQNSILRKLFF